MRVAFKTIGCRLNQFETDSLITRFKENGIEIVNSFADSDAVIINTCTVTSKSDYKSRNIIKKAIKENPNAIVIVTGCYAETDAETIKAIRGVDYVINNENKSRVMDILLKHQSLEESKISGHVFDFPAPVKGIHTRAYLKVQDGCDNYCSYCKVAIARGIEKSRDISSVIYDFNKIISAGIKEIVLTGVNTGSYQSGIESLLKSLLTISGDFRIHISSIEMRYVNSVLIEIFKNPQICYHLHIPLQSGSDKILKKMNRKYSKEQFLNMVKNIKHELPCINLTTDVIVGFPGETDEDFNHTLDVIKESEFSHIHTFKYSPRKGTKAYSFKDDVPEDVKKSRSFTIRELSKTNLIGYKQKFINKPLQVLIETMIKVEGKDYSKGKCREYFDVLIPGEYKNNQNINCIGRKFLNENFIADIL